MREKENLYLIGILNEAQVNKVSNADSEMSFKRSPEWALARSVERGTVLKSPMNKAD